MKKTLLAAAFAVASLSASAQCTELFFSEYLEGASNNKAIEIYNPTSAPVNLLDYVIYRYNNGSPVPSDSLFPQDILAAGDVWVAGNPSAVAGILAESDTLHTITFFNGDDAMALKKISTNTILDVIGIIGNDPGTNWPVGTGATSEFTLVRMTGIHQGNSNWTVAATEYDVYAQNTFTFLGNHTMTSCCAAVALTLSSQTNVNCFGGSDGAATVSATGGNSFTYNWLATADTTSTEVGMSAGTYSVVVTNECSNFDTLAVTITEPTQLYDSLVDFFDPYCNTNNGMLQVTGVGGTGPYSYQWNNGDMDDSISGVGVGTYIAVITDLNGCIDSSIWSFQNPPAPAVTVSLTTDTVCEFTGTIILSGASPAGGTWSGTGVTDTLFDSGQPSSMYYVVTYTYTDTLNCVGTAMDSIWVDLCLGITETMETDFLLSPNPFSDVIQLQFTTTHNVISVYNMQGQIVYTETVDALNSTIDLRSLATGIFTLKVENESGVTVKKIQKVD